MTAREVPFRDRGNRHPQWCDRSLCSRFGGGREVIHESAVTTWWGTGWRIDTYLHMADDLSYDEPWRAFVVVEIDEPDMAPNPVQVHLRTSEARALRDQISAHLARAEAAELADPAPFRGGEGDA